MIDIPESNRAAAFAQLLRQNEILERIFFNKIKPILGRQWLDAAKMVSMNIANIDYAVDKQRNRLIDLYKFEYRKISNISLRETTNRVNEIEGKAYISYDNKDSNYLYETFVTGIIADRAKTQSGLYNETTKKILYQIIGKGIDDGLSYNQIATEIRKLKEISNINRALRIARTEVHSIRNETIDASMETSGLEVKTKEWMTAADERVRSEDFSHVNADGETVGMKDLFTATGEGLRFPGDFAGSPGNIINCRCIVLYHTK
jgi:uncharacterized protein with gpF-like domain